MLIQCTSCPARPRACADCSVGALLTLAPTPLDRRPEARLDAAERAAVEVFLRAGMVHPDDAADLVALVEEEAVAV